MKHIRLFLSFLILILMFVPVHAQNIDTKVYYRLTVGSIDPLNLSIYEFQQGNYAPNPKEPSEAVIQLWRFVDLGNGFFRLINASQPLLSLDVINDTTNNNQLVLAKTNDVLGQQWKLSPLLDGFRLSNRWQEGKCIEVTIEEFPKVVLGKNERSSNQMWVLSKTDISVIEIMELTSRAFKDGAKIPVKYTGEGDDVSPPLAWKGAPAGTKSFMIICTDPDAPSPKNPDPIAFVHWFVLNIPANTTYLLEGLPRMERLSTPAGAVQAPNGFDEIGYSGPMPPAGSGPHRYFFRIFALDRVLRIDPNLTPEEFLKTIEKSVLAVGQLAGTYEIRASSIQDSRLVWQKSALFRRVRTHGEDYGISRLKLLELGVDRRDLLCAVKDWSERRKTCTTFLPQ